MDLIVIPLCGLHCLQKSSIPNVIQKSHFTSVNFSLNGLSSSTSILFISKIAHILRRARFILKSSLKPYWMKEPKVWIRLFFKRSRFSVRRFPLLNLDTFVLTVLSKRCLMKHTLLRRRSRFKVSLFSLSVETLLGGVWL